MNSRKFSLGKAPFIRRSDLTQQNTSGFMRDFIIALCPLILFAWVKNGLLPFLDNDTTFFGMLYPLILPIAGGLFSLGLEAFWYKFIIKNKPLKERLATSYPVIPGLLLGMIVSVSTPLWVLFIGTIFATVIAKLLFGGFGHNIFNPALIGFLFLTTYSYSGLITGGNLFGAAGYLNPSEVGSVVSGATPMTVFAADRFAGVGKLIEEYGLLNMFLGFTPGALAETSAALCLVALIYLLVRKVINWRIPVIYIGTVFVLTYIIGAFNGYAGTLDYALFGIFNGALMFGAVFMATEPVTSPRNPNGKVLYALALGVITVVFRFASKVPEGVAISILVMNMFTAIIERFATKLRVEPNKRKVVLSYSLVGLLLLGIASFPVVSSIPAPVVTPEYEYVASEQDYKTLDFVYKFKSGDVEFSVTTGQDFAIKSVSNNEFNNADAKAVIAELIKSNKITNFVLSAEEGVDYLKLVVQTRGFGGKDIKSTFTLDENNVITAVEIEYEQTYENGEWEAGNGKPKEVMPDRIIEHQADLSGIKTVAGATVTSKAIIKAVEIVKDYVAYLDTITELTLVAKTQDLDTLDFVYVFRNADGKTLVKTNTNYEITSEVDAAIKADVEKAIEGNKFVEYIKSATDEEIVVITRGFGGKDITSTFTYDEEFNITAVSITYDQTYDQGEWDSADGRPRDVMPGRIVEHQEDLTQVETVSGATVTSKAIIKAAETARNYLSNKEANNE